MIDIGISEIVLQWSHDISLMSRMGMVSKLALISGPLTRMLFCNSLAYQAAFQLSKA